MDRRRTDGTTFRFAPGLPGRVLHFSIAMHGGQPIASRFIRKQFRTGRALDAGYYKKLPMRLRMFRRLADGNGHAFVEPLWYLRQSVET